MSQKKPFYRVVMKKRPGTDRVLIFICSYKMSWRLYAVAIRRLWKMGYEVVVYDVNDYLLDNDDPQVLVDGVEAVCADIHERIEQYKKEGIEIFDGVGNSLGSFLLFNYVVRHPLRKVVLNSGGFMSRVIFDSHSGPLFKTRKHYEAKGYDLARLQEKWVSIDASDSPGRIKAEQVLLFQSERDHYVSAESTQDMLKSMRESDMQLTVRMNKRLGHNATVLKGAHSAETREFFLN